MKAQGTKQSKTHKKSYGDWLGGKIRVKRRWLMIQKLLRIKYDGFIHLFTVTLFSITFKSETDGSLPNSDFNSATLGKILNL